MLNYIRRKLIHLIPITFAVTALSFFFVDMLPGDVADAIAQVFKQYIGFDSVMVYQFDKTYCGEVIGEAASTDSRSFKGLKFPASDIPSQARELYLKNRVRCVYDVEEQVIGLKPSVKEAERPPLDLSMSMVRSVSPMHIAYLKNMGIRSSFSVSLFLVIT